MRKSSVFLHKRQEFLGGWPTPLILVVGQKGRKDLYELKGARATL